MGKTEKKTKRINFCGNGWAPLLENIFYQNFRKLMTEPLNSEDRKLKINGLTIYGFWQLKTVHYWYHLNHLIYWASIETFPRRNKKFSKNKINFHFFNILLIYFIWNRIIIYSIQQERTLQYQKLFLQLLQNTNFLIGFKNEIQDHKTSSQEDLERLRANPYKFDCITIILFIILSGNFTHFFKKKWHNSLNIQY